MNTRFEGSLQSWNDERGFGFIAADQGDEPVFVHIKAFGPGAARPVAQQRLSFAVERGPDGKKRACEVQPVVDGLRSTSRQMRDSQQAAGRFWHAPRNAALLLLIPALAALLAYLGWRYGSTRLAAVWYGLMSVATFVAYARDKRAAQRGEWRTSENKLLLMGLLNGWPGALLAQQLLRHKSSKTSFLLPFWITVAINLTWLLYRWTPLGMHERWAIF